MHEHNSNREKPETAIEEALFRVEEALTASAQDVAKLSFFEFRKRSYVKGVQATLAVIHRMLHHLYHKYDNENGDLN